MTKISTVISGGSEEDRNERIRIFGIGISGGEKAFSETKIELAYSGEYKKKLVI